jgi:hypothetical protein
MKPTVCKPKSAAEFGLKKDSLKRSKDDAREMQEYFLKLRGLVPGLEADAALSKVQILQSVIDYILDLELTLDFDPLAATKKICQHPFTEPARRMVSSRILLKILRL